MSVPVMLPTLIFECRCSELASGWPGGVYNWVGEGISEPMGLLAVWCQFAQTIFYYPALLDYVALRAAGSPCRCSRSPWRSGRSPG
jgi:glutamate:GABA antiporter